jgi:hypothetical protein
MYKKQMDYYNIIDPILTITWKYLDVIDILSLVMVDHTHYTLWNDEDMWRYLLERDYDIVKHGIDPYRTYIRKYHHTHATLYDISRYYLASMHDKAIPSTAKRGDLIRIIYGISTSMTSNSRICIYNGTGIEELVYRHGYVYPPPTFTVGDEFTLTHWNSILSNVVSIDIKKYRDELIENVSVFSGGVHTYFHGDLDIIKILIPPSIRNDMSTCDYFKHIVSTSDDLIFQPVNSHDGRCRTLRILYTS